MPMIYLLKDTSAFEETNVSAGTVGELRSELSLQSEAVNVNKVVANDSMQLREGDHVAAVKSNKTGG